MVIERFCQNTSYHTQLHIINVFMPPRVLVKVWNVYKVSGQMIFNIPPIYMIMKKGDIGTFSRIPYQHIHVNLQATVSTITMISKHIKT